MFIVDSNDSIEILKNRTSVFQEREYYKALVQFPHGLDWVSTDECYSIGTYEGYSLTINNGKVVLSI